jgi:hypothetical protein
MDYSSKIAKHVASIPRSGIRDFFDLVVGRDDVISLGVGELLAASSLILVINEHTAKA